MDNIGKRLLHVFFGVIAGSGIGWYLGLPEYFIIGAVAGALFCGITAFFMLDRFWEEFRDYF